MKALSLESRFRIHSYRYLQAAKIIEKENENDSLIAPCCQNIGLALELFLKSRLLRSSPDANLRCYGHDLHRMWTSPWAEDVRRVAEEAAEGQLVNVKSRWGKPADPLTLLKAQDELDRHIAWLSDGYSRETDYALRYPRDGTTTVPSPEFLIPVLEHVFDSLG